MKYGEIGILQIGDERYGFRPIEMTREPYSGPILTGELLENMFRASNRKAMAFKMENPERGGPQIKNVIFNDPATVVYWADGTKTVVKCQEGDTYSKETGLALCIAKKYLGNKGNFNEVFKKWIPEETARRLFFGEDVETDDMRTRLKKYCNSRFCNYYTENQCPLIGYTCMFRDMSDDEIRDAYRIALLEK